MTNILSNFNFHTRDSFIEFYEVGHKYEIKNDKEHSYTSVTTWIHKLFPVFDADKVINNIMKGPRWNPSNKYWGMTAEEIKESWNKNGASVAEQGTNLHYSIECFMNNHQMPPPYHHTALYQDYITLEQQIQSLEWRFFLQFVQDYPDLKPYRTEWTVFHEDVKLAGSIDMVYENEDGSLSIYDWKRSKDIMMENKFNKFSLHPFIEHIPDTNYWHYAIQLNTYKKILEDKYDKQVKELFLVKLHPDNTNVNYELIEVPILEKEMTALFEERKQLFI